MKSFKQDVFGWFKITYDLKKNTTTRLGWMGCGSLENVT